MFGEYSYESLFERQLDDCEVLASQSFGRYQGDLVIVLAHGSEEDGEWVTTYGIAVASFGSCEYCDALQSCSTEEEVDLLFEQLLASVDWFDSLEEVDRWLGNQLERPSASWVKSYHHEPTFYEAVGRLRAELGASS